MNATGAGLKRRPFTEHLLKSARLSKRIHTARMKNSLMISSLPILILMPHSRCDCRCIMCDIWNGFGVQEISEADLKKHLGVLLELSVRWVILSGGEPLLHPHLFRLCDLLRHEGVKVTLLSTGQRLEELSPDIASRTDETILSLDGPEQVHDAIRRVKGAYVRIKKGILEVRSLRPKYPFSGRVTVQRLNFMHLRETIQAARALGLDSISFLAVDVSSTAFNRPSPWDARKKQEVIIPQDRIVDMETEIENLIKEYDEEIKTGYIREGPEKLKRIVHYFRALLGEETYVSPRCNAPWVSAVIEADGTVRPCFFHQALGNIQRQSLNEILNGPEAILFRESLDVSANPICQRCVCSLYLPSQQIQSEL